MSNHELEIELLKRDKVHSEEKISDLEKRVEKLDDIYVRLSRYQIIEKIVFTLTLGTLATVIGGVIQYKAWAYKMTCKTQ